MKKIFAAMAAASVLFSCSQNVDDKIVSIAEEQVQLSFPDMKNPKVESIQKDSLFSSVVFMPGLKDSILKYQEVAEEYEKVSDECFNYEYGDPSLDTLVTMDEYEAIRERDKAKLPAALKRKDFLLDEQYRLEQYIEAEYNKNDINKFFGWKVKVDVSSVNDLGEKQNNQFVFIVDQNLNQPVWNNIYKPEELDSIMLQTGKVLSILKVEWDEKKRIIEMM